MASASVVSPRRAPVGASWEVVPPASASVVTETDGRALLRAAADATYVALTFAAIITVGDPIMVLMLHMATCAAVAAGAPGSRLARDVMRIARVTCSSDVRFVTYMVIVHTLVSFFTMEVLAAPVFGVQAYVVTAAVASCARVLENRFTLDSAASSASDSPSSLLNRASPMAAASLPLKQALFSCAGAVAGVFLCTVGMESGMQRGPSMFPTTEFDGVTSCILLFMSLCGHGAFLQYETRRNADIDKSEAALDGSSGSPDGAEGFIKQAPPTRFDPWSRAVYANAFGFCASIILALVFRIRKPYEEAVLDGEAGVFMLISCGAAAVATIASATAPREENAVSQKRPVVVAGARAIMVLLAWQFGGRRASSATALGTLVCVVSEAFAHKQEHAARANDVAASASQQQLAARVIDDDVETR